MIYPIIMQGVTALLSANQIGSPLDFRSLQNRTNKILRVEEIRFHPTAENGQVVGSQIRTCGIQLRIGNEPITSSFAPLPAMTWPIGDYATEGSLDLTNDVLSGFYLRFSKPVLLAPGQAIALRVRHESATAMILRTTVLCREANPKDQGYTPWISHFSTPRRVDGVGNYVDQSTESDLNNPFQDSMFVERFIARVFANDQECDNGQETAANSDMMLYPFNAVRVRVDMSDATQIVRDATPVGIAIDYVRRTWMINSILGAKGFYRFSVESTLNPRVIADGAAFNVQTFIGMLGYRAVR